MGVCQWLKKFEPLKLVAKFYTRIVIFICPEKNFFRLAGGVLQIAPLPLPQHTPGPKHRACHHFFHAYESAALSLPVSVTKDKGAGC